MTPVACAQCRGVKHRRGYEYGPRITVIILKVLNNSLVNLKILLKIS